MIDKLIEEKRQQIKHYEGVLERYGSGRWTDMGRRHLAELKQQLIDLQQQTQYVDDEPI